MHALLDALGNPQRAYRSVHVVGTNGKSTATRTIAALLRAEGLEVGAYTSPHVSGWHERLDTDPESFERAVARVRAAAEAVGATQFEALTAAALAHFAERKVDAAVVEAGLGGRLDATNVLDAPVVLLTNVGLEHTDVLGDTREEIAREKLAVARPGATVVLAGRRVARAGARRSTSVVGGAREAAEAFVGHPIEARRRRLAARAARAARAGRGPRRGAHARGASTGCSSASSRAAGRSSPRSSATRTPTAMLRAPRRRRPDARRHAQQQRPRARRAGARRPRRAVLRACRGRRRPGCRPSRGRASLGPVLVTGLALSPCRPARRASRTRPCARPGGSGSPSSPSRSRCSRRSSACRSPLAT